MRAVVTAIVVLLVSAFAIDASAAVRLERLSGFNGPVTAISQPDANGTRYVGGRFTAANPWLSGPGAAFGTASGAIATRFPRIGTVIGGAEVTASTADGSGGVYIGGTFDCIGGDAGADGDCTDADEVVRENLAHLMADGSVDPAWSPSTDARVFALARDGSTVYVGGGFSTVGGLARDGLAAIGVDGRPTGWNPGANGTVRALAVRGSTVYVGGSFTTVGGASRSRLAAVDSGGGVTDWHPAADASVNALAVVGTTVYAGGSFTSVDALPRVGLAAIGIDGTVSAWRADIDAGAGHAIQAIAASGSTVYVGGAFSTFGGAARAGLAGFEAGGAVSDWNPGAGGEVTTLAVGGATVYVGGSFGTLAGQSRTGLGAVDASGRVTAWAPNVQLDDVNYQVSTITLTGAYAYAGGDFATAGGTPRFRLAAIAADGSLTSWAPAADSDPSSLLVSGSIVYVGGTDITTINGVTRRGLAAIGMDGTLSAWDPGLTKTFDGYVRSLVMVGSTLLIGGSFDAVGGIARAGAAAIDLAGACGTRYIAACLKSWDPGDVGYIYSMAPVGDVLIVGGLFNYFIGTAHNRLAAVSISQACLDAYSDGACGYAWNPYVSQAFHVATIGSTAFIAGSGLTIDSQIRRGGAAMPITPGCLASYSVGSCLSSWNPDTGSANPRALATRGTTVYLGGDFTTAGGSPRAGAAAVRGDATCVASYSSACLEAWAPSVVGTVEVLVPTDSKVLLGGTFSAIDGKSRTNIAEVGTDGALLPALPTIAPTLTAVAPASGSTVGGTTITLTGTGLSGATVTIGGVAAKDVVDIDDGTITAVTPPGAAGPADIVITNAFGTAKLVGGFTYVRPTNRFRILSRTIRLDSTRLRFVVSVPGPGTLKLAGRFLPGARAGRSACTAQRKVAAKGAYRMTCRFSSALRAARRQGPVRLRVPVTYTPTGGLARTLTLRLLAAATRPAGQGPGVTG